MGVIKGDTRSLDSSLFVVPRALGFGIRSSDVGFRV